MKGVVKSMKLYNTMSRTVEDFTPIAPPAVGLYACGFTVYDYTHLGHLRKYTMDDVLIRALRHAGYTVKFIQNVTDVGHLSSDADTGEDKLEKGAKKYGKSVWEIAHEFEDYFFRSMDVMGNLRPDVSCRATEHIAEQLDMVLELEKKGYTYVIEGDGVYFDTAKDPEYGKLARLRLKDLQEGARVEKVEGKRNPTDFALWKFERPGENRAMVWESPWAKRSFPGWHIECSAMAMKYLGPQFDIHTGGIDHIPVHHTNEIAQAEAATGKKPFVRYWVHHNHLRVEGVKMSKSLNNFFTIDDIQKRGYDPKALRLLFLTTHYRSEMNFTWESLEGSQKSWHKLTQLILECKTEQGRTVLSDEKLKKIDQYRQRFFDYMEDDLKTPEALSVLYEVTKSNIPGQDKYDLLCEFDEVLGLGFRQLQAVTTPTQIIVDMTILPKPVQDAFHHRQAARDAKDWQKADQLRDELVKAGYEVIDSATGQQLRPIHPNAQTKT